MVVDRHTVDGGAHHLEELEVTGLFLGAAGAEADVVNEHGVTGRVHAAVLGVFPTEGVRTGADGIAVFVPARNVGAVGKLLFAVDGEDALVPSGVRAFTHAEGSEAHRAVGGKVASSLDGGGAAGHAAVGTLHAVGACIGVLGRDGPRIGAH